MCVSVCHWVIHPSLLRPKMEVPLTLASIMDTYHSHVANQYFSVQNLTRQLNSWAHNSLPRFLRVWVRAIPPTPPQQDNSGLTWRKAGNEQGEESERSPLRQSGLQSPVGCWEGTVPSSRCLDFSWPLPVEGRMREEGSQARKVCSSLFS